MCRNRRLKMVILYDTDMQPEDIVSISGELISYIIFKHINHTHF